MPRPRKPDAPTALVASAVNLTTQPFATPRRGTLDWQREAWYFYDACGELRFASNWLGNAMSRVTLAIKRDTPDGPEEVTTGPAVDALLDLSGGESGQSQMLASFGIHLTVPGDCYLLGETDPDTDEDTWMVLSTDELTGKGKRWMLDRGDGRKRPVADDAMVVRIWRSHPRSFAEADSPVRAVLPILRELEGLTKHVAATVDSRLAGAGLLLVPSEMSFGAPVEGEPPDSPEADPFLVALTQTMVQAIADRSSAAAYVPVMVKAPGDVIGNVKHLSFATPFDEQAQQLREEAIRRLALGMDLPPEIMLGQADSNHWSAWQIEESALKVHVEPMCELVCAALTEQWLHPVLSGLGGDDDTLYVDFDTSDLRLRPNRSSEAIQLYDRIELSGDALRRETGFEPDDAPDDGEVEESLLRKVAQGTPTPQMTAMALSALNVPVVPQPSTPSRPAAPALPGPARPAPALPAPAGPSTSPQQAPAAPAPSAESARRPVPEQQTAAGLTLACHLVLHRAVERAYNRLGRRGNPTSRRPCPDQAKRADALKDAWDTVPAVADCYGIDAALLTTALHAYADRLLATGESDPSAAAALRGLVRRA